MTNRLIFLITFIFFSNFLSAQITPPQAFLGFIPGSDRHLADWTQITGYFQHLDQQSPRIKVVELGKSTEGKPIIMVIIASAANQKRLADIKEAMHLLADPRLITEAEKDSLLKCTPAVALINCSLHSTEIGASQFALQFAYNLATDHSKKARAILSRTICLLIPSSNPDGHQFVVDWYRNTLNTPAEGSLPQGLYHKYAGHDNNRDWFMLNLQETRVITRVLYKEWFPQVIFDMHEMAGNGPRLVIPPQFEVANPLIDPLIHQGIRYIGDFITNQLRDQNVTGIANNTVFDMWWHGGFRTAPYFHNMIGVLSEVASARLATPDTVKHLTRLFASNDLSVQDGIANNIHKPWRGSVWRLADIVDIENKSAYALMEVLARGRKSILDNFYAMGRRAIDLGLQDSLSGYIIPFEQHDPSSARKLLDVLMAQGIEVYRQAADAEGNPGNAENGYFIPTAQPYRANILCLFEPLVYPESVMRPYDITAWTLPYQMGVRVDKIENLPDHLERIVENELQWPVTINFAIDAPFLALDSRSNDSYRFVQELLNAGMPVWRITRDFPAMPGGVKPGWFVVEADDWIRDNINSLMHNYSFAVKSMYMVDSIAVQPLRPVKLAILETCAGNIDQGWTKFVLDSFSFPYESLSGCKLKFADLAQNYDALILPSISARSLMWGERTRPYTPLVQTENTAGLGVRGLENLQSYVRAGGTLISFGEAAKSIATLFELNMKNVIHPFNGFSAPGSLLQISLKNDRPLCYGMPENTAIFYNNDPAFIVNDGEVLGKYTAHKSFLSGYIRNGEILKERAAMVSSDYGKGKIILFGFRPQHRGQTYSTFKLVFNAILSASRITDDPPQTLPTEE